jgi:phosphate transport system permease protein
VRRRVQVPAWHIAAEWTIRILAAAAIAGIVLIFVFIVREAVPLLWDAHDVHAGDLVLPRQWPGYEEPVFVWQPVGKIPKYSLVPLFVGTLKITVLAMLVSAPIGIACAVYVAHYASRRVREIVKPIIELLAGIPSVVLGFVGLMLLASWLHDAFGFTYRLNAVVAALALSITVIPVVFTISEDALTAVPRTMIEAALAVGARTHQVALRVTIPAALPGIAAALVLGLGRAVGETMVVLMASGNAAVIDLADWSTSVRTVTATIAAELGEVPRGDPHWRMLFLLGAILFAVTFTLNAAARVAVRRLGRRLEGDA